MNHEKIDRMKQEYEQIEVPEALKTQVEAGIRKGKRETQKGSIRFLKGAATVAAAMVALVISVNVSPTIAHAMEELEERERTIVILKYFEEWKIDDIADLLKENPNTVKSILYRSLKKLKIKMSREEIA